MFELGWHSTFQGRRSLWDSYGSRKTLVWGHVIAFCVTLGNATRFLYLGKKGTNADLIGSLVVWKVNVKC